MEVIRIPEVSLVDATGRRIGVYNDNPDWWQKLKAKQQQNQGKQLSIEQNVKETKDQPGKTLTLVRQMTPINNIDTESTSNIRARLIKDTENSSEKNLEVSTIQSTIQTLNLNSSLNGSFDESSTRQCNVIGETPLHIAIMFDDFNTIKFLIETKGFDVNQRNVGGKFTGGFNSKVSANLIEQSKYECLAYYGEFPLAFAACFASKEIYDYLIEKGADPNLQDTNGNTVLHVLVINNKLDMFQYATNHPMRKALLTIKNNQDLTPINLAAKLGRKDLFEKMLELRNIEFWRYSNITCSAYPLDGLDTVDNDGKIAWNAALSYIVNGDTEDHLDMLKIGVVDRLLEDKWSTFAQRRFFKKLVISVIHLLCLSLAVYFRADDSESLAIWPPKSGTTWARYLFEIAVLIGCLANLFLQAQEIYAQGFLYYVKNLFGEPANVSYLVFCIFILIAVPFRFVSFKDGIFTNRYVEDTLVILAIPCGWFHLLFYARVANVTGPFVVMIYKMIKGDILTFASIYVLLLFGFSLGFYYLYKNVGSDIVAMGNFAESLILSFQMTLGEFKARLTEFDKLYHSDFTKVIFVAFMILMHILLLNMLIAMMGNTYHQIIQKSEKEWRRQRAQVILLLERSFSPKELLKFQNKYSIKLPSKDANNNNEVGLMVIKKVAKTKAFQKTTCIRNWKKFCKTVLGLLKDNNFKAPQLLDMWANKDIKVIKAKKLKKDFDWNNYEKSSSQNQSSLTALNTNVTSVNSSQTNLNKKPPLPEPVKLKYAFESVKQEHAKQKNSLNNPKVSLNNENIEASDSSQSSANNQAKTGDEVTKLEKIHQQNTIDDSSGGSRPNSETTSDYIQMTVQAPNLVSRYMPKKTFYPNQTSKIYPVASNSFSSVNSTSGEYSDPFNFSKQSISPVKDYPKIDLSDIKRPFSSSQKQNGEAYIKRDTYPRFAQRQPTNLTFPNYENKSTDENMSIDSDNGIYKLRSSPDGDESGKEKETESKI